MDVLSFQALAFLGAAIAALFVARRLGAAVPALCLVNLAFLALADPWAPAVFLAVTAGAWLLAKAAARGMSSVFFAVLTLPFAALLFLPKTGIFGVSEAAAGLGGFAANFARSPAAFVGASYFTLRALQLVFDARREGRAPLGLLDTIAWNGFFPTIVAGPIERSQHFALSLEKLGRPDLDDVLDGSWRVFVGLVKKVVLSQIAYAWAAPLLDFERGIVPQRLDALLALYAFGFYFYFDFSGYSDLALGAGRFCGIRLAENFDNPMFRPSIAEFWRTWHISLSTWIRDYVFVPLCGRSVNPWRARAASVASMTLCGLWHGPTLGWVLWGVLHGTALSVHQAWTGFLRKRFRVKQRLAKSKLAYAVSVVVMLQFLSLTWIWTAYANENVHLTIRYLRIVVGV
jgi:D-alanyl-lipoteichoic acid acyltransferase DltB (MBOAT superfamily)